jgi:hypothetical protein
MRTAGLPVPALTDDCFTLHDDTANPRIRRCAVETACGELQGTGHVDLIRSTPGLTGSAQEDSSGNSGN